MDEKTAGRMVGLPANRAFVVQLDVSVGAEPPIRGRIEHLASGSVTHFEFLTQLGRVVRVLASAAAGPAAAPPPTAAKGEAPGPPHADPTRRPPARPPRPPTPRNPS